MLSFNVQFRFMVLKIKILNMWYLTHLGDRFPFDVNKSTSLLAVKIASLLAQLSIFVFVSFIEKKFPILIKGTAVEVNLFILLFTDYAFQTSSNYEHQILR